MRMNANSRPQPIRVVTRLLATAVCLILASSSLFAEMYECTQLECTYQRIKDDGTLGPLRKKKNGETIIINDGDYDLSDGWVIVNPPA